MTEDRALYGATCRHRHTEYSPTIDARVCLDCRRMLPRGRNKFNAKRTTVDGITFDSGKEAGRWTALRRREQAGEIAELDRQIRYPLFVGDALLHVCDYIADFVYLDAVTGQRVVEDCKGHRTREYLIKRRLMKAVYGIEVKET